MKMNTKLSNGLNFLSICNKAKLTEEIPNEILLISPIEISNNSQYQKHFYKQHFCG